MLHFESGAADKDYRILAAGERTALQYGRAYTAGEVRRKDPQAADPEGGPRVQ
jgi:hypothetical protein